MCSVDSSYPGGSTFYVMNPWLGGAFNVYERSDDGSDGGCDTDALRRGNGDDDEDDDGSLVLIGLDSGEIDPSCSNPAVCDSTKNRRLRDSQAPVCVQRAGRTPETATVPRSSPHNLCMRTPRANPTFCEHGQGMLHGMQGAPVRDLHRFVGLEPQGVRQGLFGNPLFAGIRPPSATQGR